MRVISPVTCERRKTTVTMLGLKKYLFFGPRSVSHTETLEGRMSINNIIVDFEGEAPPEGKFEIRHEGKTLLGVSPILEIRPDIWECVVDNYRMDQPGLAGLDGVVPDACCGDPSCPSNN